MQDLIEIEDGEDEFDWSPTPLVEINEKKIRENKYIDNLYKGSGLKINHGAAVRNAWDRGGPLGLFRLFYSKRRMEVHRQWTNEQLAKDGKTEVSTAEFEAADGLELAMSIENYNRISDYWASGAFLGCDTFKRTMA